MEAINYAEQKILLAQTILAITDADKISQIQLYVSNLLENTHNSESSTKLLSFSDWNKQFDDKLNLDDFIPEYKMTLKDFRMKIYNAEKEKGMSKKEFIERINELE